MKAHLVFLILLALYACIVEGFVRRKSTAEELQEAADKVRKEEADFDAAYLKREALNDRLARRDQATR
jgi:hypothetical protein